MVVVKKMRLLMSLRLDRYQISPRVLVLGTECIKKKKHKGLSSVGLSGHLQITYLVTF